MIDDPTRGIHAAQSRTGVHTLKLLARLLRGTVCIDGAFWAARQVGIAKVVGNALASSRPAPVGANGVGSAR